MTLTQFPDGKYYALYFNTNYGTWIPTNEASVYTAYQDGNKVYAYPVKHNDNFYKIPAATESTFINGKQATKTLGSAAVIIRSNNPTISYKRKSRPMDRLETGLDLENELKVLRNDQKIYKDDDIMVFAYKSGSTSAGFFKVTGELNHGTVVFPLADWQGTGDPSRLDVIFVGDSEATAIMGVKEYINSLKNSDAIYNMQGVRVSATQKGQMYIQNGKKFIQK